jgi:hypothetical protein
MTAQRIPTMSKEKLDENTTAWKSSGAVMMVMRKQDNRVLIIERAPAGQVKETLQLFWNCLKVQLLKPRHRFDINKQMLLHVENILQNCHRFWSATGTRLEQPAGKMQKGVFVSKRWRFLLPVPQEARCSLPQKSQKGIVHLNWSSRQRKATLSVDAFAHHSYMPDELMLWIAQRSLAATVYKFRPLSSTFTEVDVLPGIRIEYTSVPYDSGKRLWNRLYVLRTPENNLISIHLSCPPQEKLKLAPKMQAVVDGLKYLEE